MPRSGFAQQVAHVIHCVHSDAVSAPHRFALEEDITINETTIDVKRFDLDFFSINPTVIDKEDRLCVVTPRWRMCVGLISGYRCLEVYPSYSEIVLYRRSAWFFKSVLRLPFNKIRNIKPLKFTYHVTRALVDCVGTSTSYFTLWSVYLVLDDQGDMLPLFQWEKGLGSVPGQAGSVSPFINYEVADKSDQEKDYNRLVSRFCELTGKSLNWE